MQDKTQAFWIKLMKAGAVTGCHQRYDRSFFYKEYQFPVCARCTGLFLGYIFGLVLYFALNQLLSFQASIVYFLIPALFFTALLGIDGFGQLKGKWKSNNARRFVTGLLCGSSVVCFAVKGIVMLAEYISVAFILFI